MRNLLALVLLGTLLSPTAWSQCGVTRFLPGATEHEFGRALAVQEVNGVLIAAIGAPGDDAGAFDAGAVVVHTSLDGGLLWSGPTRLVAAQPSARARLGSSLAMDDQGRLLAGAPGADYGGKTGAVLIFRWDAALGFQETQVLLPEDGVLEQEFGTSLSLESFGTSSANLIVGAPGHSGDTGTAFSFGENPSSGGFVWTQTWTAPAPKPGDRFGESVRRSINLGPSQGPEIVTSLVGAPGRAVGGVKTGAVFAGSGQTQRLALSGLQAGDRFGASMTVAGTRLLVGAPGRDSGGLDTGSVFALRLQWPATVLDSKELVAPVQELGAGFGTALAGDPMSWRRAQAAVGANSLALQSARLLAIGEEDLVDWDLQRSSVQDLELAPQAIATFGDGVLLGGQGPSGPEVRWAIYGGRDVNANGQPDFCDIQNDPSLDLDMDGLLDDEGPSISLSFPMSLLAETPAGGLVESLAETVQFTYPLVPPSAGYLADASLSGSFEAGGLERLENLSPTDGLWTTLPAPGYVQLRLDGHLDLWYFNSIDDCGCSILLDPYDGVTDFAGTSGQLKSFYAEQEFDQAWLFDPFGSLHLHELDTETFLGQGLTQLEVTLDTIWNSVTPGGPGPFEREVELRVQADLELNYLLYPRALDPAIQSTHCTSNPSSTGQTASLVAGGSARITDDLFVLMVADLPVGQLGYFLSSRTADNVPFFGGSQGTLCLGAPILRLADQVLAAGADGRVTERLDLAGLPPGWTVSAGETRYFQFWFRDQNPGSTSNTSDGLQVTFE